MNIYNEFEAERRIDSVEVVKRRYLFNPDHIHRGYSIERLKKIGKIEALEGLLGTNFKVTTTSLRRDYSMIIKIIKNASCSTAPIAK